MVQLVPMLRTAFDSVNEPNLPSGRNFGPPNVDKERFSTPLSPRMMRPMKHLKIFTVDQVGPTVILTPDGDASGFRYRDLQAEANSLRSHLMKPANQHLVVDLSKMQYFGSEFIGALVSMLREVRARGGKAYFCAATEQMLQVLQNMSLFKLWPHYATRDEALAAIEAPPAAK